MSRRTNEDRDERRKSSKSDRDERDRKSDRDRRDSRYSTLSELGSGDDKYKQMAKKLSKDKTELKEKLKKVLDDLESKTREHRSELERTQEYFQDQILELTERNNQLKSEMSKKDNKKELQTIKRLESTITTLQERLNNQTQELDQYKENLGQITEEKEHQFRKTISELQDQLRLSKEQELKIKKEFQNVINACEKEKQFIMDKVRLEKETEISRINQEKNNAIRMVEMDKDFLEKKTKEAEQRREKELIELKANLEKSKKENELKTINALENCKKTVENLEQDFQGKLFENNRLHSIDLENVKKDCDKKISNIIAENNQKMEALALTLGTEHEKIKKERDQALIQMEKMYQDHLKKEDELIRKQESELYKINSTWTDKLDFKEKDYNTLKLKYEKQMGESIEINQKLQQEINTHKLNIKKLQENSQNLNAQYINSLNKQKETADREIFERDQMIVKLNTDLKRIVTESVEKLNEYEKKVLNLEKDYQDEKGKVEELQNREEKHLNSISKHREIMDKLVEKAKVLQAEKEQLDRRVNSLENDYNIAEKDRVKIKAELVKLEQLDLKNIELLQENKSLSDSLTKLRNDHVQTVNDLNSEKHQNRQNEGQIKELNMRCSVLAEELDAKMKTLNATKSDLENVSKTLGTVKDEYTRLRATLLEDARQKMNEIKGDYTKQITTLEKRTAMLENERSKMTDQIIALSAEKDRLSNLVDISSKPNPDYLAKIEENKSLNEENKKLRIDLIQLQNEFNVKTIRSEDEYKNRIASVNKKVLEQDELIKNLNSKLETLKQQYTTQLIEAKQGTPELLRKTTEERELLKKQLESTEQNLIKLQLEFASVSAEIKTRTENISKKEKDLDELEKKLKNAPPKLLDPTLKKQKDDAIANLRQAKIEISRLRDDLAKTTARLNDLEKQK